MQQTRLVCVHVVYGYKGEVGRERERREEELRERSQLSDLRKRGETYT